jgi:hypothetical protein
LPTALKKRLERCISSGKRVSPICSGGGLRLACLSQT